MLTKIRLKMSSENIYHFIYCALSWISFFRYLTIKMNETLCRRS